MATQNLALWLPLTLLLVTSEIVSSSRAKNRLLWSAAPKRVEHLLGIQPRRPVAREDTHNPTLRAQQPFHSADGRPPKRVPHLDYRCLLPNTNFACGSCMSVVTCIGYFAYEYQCPSDCPMCREDTDFQGAVCKTEPDPICDCANATPPTSIWPDPWDISAFLVCDAGALTMGRCNQGFEYQKDTKKCKVMPTFSACRAMGASANPDGCQFYSHCVVPAVHNTIAFMHQIIARCPSPDLAWSASAAQCKDPEFMPPAEICSKAWQDANNPVTHKPIITTTRPPGPVKPPIVPGPIDPVTGQPTYSVAQLKRIILEAFANKFRRNPTTP